MRPLRQFTRDGEVIARAWRDCVETVDPWRETSTPGSVGGEAAGYFVTSGPVNAYAKPSKLDATPNPVPRAAHEKIAADYAFDLALPLPPVVLHRWPRPPVGDQPNVALSLFPFLAVHKWQVIKAVPGLEDQMKLELRELSSALVPFDTWVENRDRPNDGNLLLSKAGTDPGAPPSVAYIDYSYSLAYGWRSGGFKNVAPVGIYPTDAKDADPLVMGEVLNRIEALPDDHVREVVARVPDVFLAPADKSLITDGLIYRKPLIRAALKAIYGGIP